MSVKNEKLSKTVKMPMMAMEETPTRLTINLDKYPDFEYDDVGEICKGSFEGKISRVSKSEDYNEITIEISKLKSKSANKSKPSEDDQDGEDNQES